MFKIWVKFMEKTDGATNHSIAFSCSKSPTLRTPSWSPRPRIIRKFEKGRSFQQSKTRWVKIENRISANNFGAKIARKWIARKWISCFSFLYWVPLLNSNREIVSEKSDRTWLKFRFSIFPIAIRVRSSAPRNFSFWDTHRSEMVYPGRFRAWAIQDLPLTLAKFFKRILLFRTPHSPN